MIIFQLLKILYILYNMNINNYLVTENDEGLKYIATALKRHSITELSVCLTFSKYLQCDRH